MELPRELSNKEPKLVELTNRIDMVNNKIVQNIDKIDNINNVLMGLIPIPECESNTEKQIERAGLIGLLEDKIEELEKRTEDITISANRLKDSNIII